MPEAGPSAPKIRIGTRGDHYGTPPSAVLDLATDVRGGGCRDRGVLSDIPDHLPQFPLPRRTRRGGESGSDFVRLPYAHVRPCLVGATRSMGVAPASAV